LPRPPWSFATNVVRGEDGDVIVVGALGREDAGDREDDVLDADALSHRTGAAEELLRRGLSEDHDLGARVEIGLREELARRQPPAAQVDLHHVGVVDLREEQRLPAEALGAAGVEMGRGRELDRKRAVAALTDVHGTHAAALERRDQLVPLEQLGPEVGKRT
jgi:hypothetical protein